MLGVICIWPSAPFTHSLVHKALESLETPVNILASVSDASSNSPALLQWSSYDEIDHELSINQSILQSSYIIRKSLIRKHFLSRSIFSYITKHPTSVLKLAWPRTYEMGISFADELDELFADELWELGEELGTSERWWILKPGMADRGNGIRLFHDRPTLEHIFDEFEEKEEETEDEESNTAVITSQLRHFVIQEYILHPLLFDPREVPIGPDSSKPSVLEGYKFHLRAYCLASGALTLYLSNRVLALFSSLPYTVPTDASNSPNSSNQVDLAPHLTNTSLQTHREEEGVRLLNELVGCRILSEGFEDHPVLTLDDVDDILGQISSVLSETFKAALENPIHFQAIPNAFELFGVDFLIDSSKSRFQIKLLEINAEPAIELTGPRLAWILEDLFVDIGKVCVEPFLTKQQASSVGDEDGWNVGETRGNLRKCLEVEVRRL
ncbi:TTL-domain-containing protein [Lentinula raphanica]|nr:TTL-domain-containing protein [Lentinula raphanica]